MHILVSNDDGFQSPGLESLVGCLKALKHQVTAVTTRVNRSGFGQAITLRKSIAVEEVKPDFFVIDGTPADSVYIGLQCLVKQPVDLVISGINNGANLADDVHYSGTFAAAMEARRNGLPSIAISITEHDVQRYQTATKVIETLLPHMSALSKQHGLAVLNINLPDIPYASIQGYQITALGRRLKAEKPRLEVDESGGQHYWLGKAGEFDLKEVCSAGRLFDFQAVQQGYISISPVSSRLIQQPFYTELDQWLAEV